MNKFKKILASKYFRFVKIFISISLIAYFLYKIDYARINSLIKHVSILCILILIILSLSRNIIGAIRFYYLVKITKKINIFEIIRQYFVASYYNNFLPTAIGGDSVRIVLVSRCGLPISSATVFVLFERFIGFYALVVISFLSSFFWHTPANIHNLIFIIFFGYTALFLIFLFIKLPQKFKILTNIKESFEAVKKQPKVIVLTFLISGLFQVVSIYISFYIGRELKIDVPFLDYLSLVPLVWLFSMIPISIGGIGLREISFVYLFGQLGINQESALLISLGTYFSLLIASVIGMLYSLQMRGHGKVSV